MNRALENAADQAWAQYEMILAEQRAQRRFLIRCIILPCAAALTGWYLAAAVTLWQNGPGVAPW